MANIRINDLPADATPVASDVIPIDQATTRKATIQNICDVGVPIASTPEAEAGVDTVKRMTPATTAAAIATRGAGLFATQAQGDLADTAVQPGDLATVATSGDYDDLSNKPVIPDISNLVVNTRAVSAGTGLTGGGDLTADRTIALSAGSIASLALADTALQPAALTGYVEESRSVSAGTGLTGGGDFSADRSISLDAASIASLALADTAVQPAALGALAALDTVTVNEITATGTPSGSTFLAGDGKWATPSGAGDLLAANNLSDVADTATSRTNLGLGNVDNTSDADKPVSTATQDELDLKAPLASPTLTGTPTAPTAASGTDTTQIATTAFANAAVAARPQAGLAIITASGNFTVPAGVTSIDVQLWGGGGAGGASSTVEQSAGGGGGGGYCRTRLSVTPGQIIAATVGAAGAGGAGAGGAGGNTTFDTLTANGGNGGSTNPIGAGGSGGSATGGTININGGYGGAGSGNITGAAHGGNGGGSAFGGSGGAVTTYSGGDGQSPGGGGSGTGGGVVGNGGNGAPGMIIIRY